MSTKTRLYLYNADGEVFEKLDVTSVTRGDGIYSYHPRGGTNDTSSILSPGAGVTVIVQPLDEWPDAIGLDALEGEQVLDAGVFGNPV